MDCSLLICHGKGKTVKNQICPSCMLLSTLKRPVDDIQCANTVMGKCSRLARCQLSISKYIFVKQLSSYQQPSICPHSRSQLASYPRRSSLQFGYFSPSHRRWIPCSPWKQLSVRFNSASVWLAQSMAERSPQQVWVRPHSHKLKEREAHKMETRRSHSSTEIFAR